MWYHAASPAYYALPELGGVGRKANSSVLQVLFLPGFSNLGRQPGQKLQKVPKKLRG